MSDRSSLPSYVTLFDSGSLPVEALAASLEGHAYDWFRGAPLEEAATRLAARLPSRFRETLYRWAGGADALPPAKVARVDADEIAAWATGLFARRRHPAVMIGSSNGAAMHLCAALGIPFLPQTVLVPMRRSLDPDDIRGDLEWGTRPAETLLRNNPEMKVYQMHDPNQDRLMLHHMAYFRLKRSRLGPRYEAFLRDVLPEGETIILMDCDFS